MFIKGISTRGMKKITQRLLGGEGYSAGTVSNINKELTEEMRAWMCAPIKDKIIYLFLDGLNLPVRRFVVSKESLLVAVGITQDGQRKILGLALGDREKAGSWREFLKDLKKRGLDTNSVKLGIMDACRG
jgi:putative transposase